MKVMMGLKEETWRRNTFLPGLNTSPPSLPLLLFLSFSLPRPTFPHTHLAEQITGVSPYSTSPHPNSEQTLLHHTIHLTPDLFPHLSLPNTPETQDGSLTHAIHFIILASTVTALNFTPQTHNASTLARQPFHTGSAISTLHSRIPEARGT